MTSDQYRGWNAMRALLHDIAAKGETEALREAAERCLTIGPDGLPDVSKEIGQSRFLEEWKTLLWEGWNR
tara:strand:- start:5896 stop:6105 length:210 start_codon:yes stop_codon:yes gene_type:complete